MDFREEVGKKMTLVVSQWDSRINFGTEFRNGDELLLQIRSPEQRARKDRELSTMDVSLADYLGSSIRKNDSDYGSMRIYHINGEAPADLVVGDGWEVEVLKCYFNPKGSLTRDGRRKIHYSVRPLQKIEVVKHRCLFDERKPCVISEYTSGRNFRREQAYCAVRTARYRIGGSKHVVDVQEAKVEGIDEIFWGMSTVLKFDKNVEMQRVLLGKDLNEERVRRVINELPQAPDALLERIGYDIAA